MRPVGSSRCRRHEAWVLPWFSSIISYTARRRARSAGCSMCSLRVCVAPTWSVVSDAPTSSGSLCGTMRTVSAVGPAVVEGRSGGCTSTSTTSCEPPNSVTEPGRIVVQPAARPIGASEKVSVVSPKLTTVSWKTADVPGTTSTSLRENHA